MKPKETDTGNSLTVNTTAVFVQGDCLKQHTGWYLQKVNKTVILPCLADIPFSELDVTALPSGYWKADHISITPITDLEYYRDEGEQFPTPHTKKHFKVKMEPDGYQYFMIVSDEKIGFSKDFEILFMDWFEDMWFHSEYCHITYLRTPGTVALPVILDSSNTLCISPF